MEATPNDPQAMRRFVLEHWSAYIEGELPPLERARMEDWLAANPAGAEYIANQRLFHQAVKAGLSGESRCPHGLQARVAAALDRCDELDEPLPVSGLRMPWVSVGALAAASLMLATSLFVVFGRDNDQPDPAEVLRSRLAPMVSEVSFSQPTDGGCHYREAQQLYHQHFEDGPELPAAFGGSQCKVAHFEVREANDRKVMRLLYDDPSGDRFALVVFRCRRVADLLPGFMDAAELEIEGRRVLLWREGNYVRALVSDGSTRKLRHRADLLRNAA